MIDEETRFQLELEQMGHYYVSGIIANDCNGPKRWCQTIEASSGREAEDFAVAMVASQVVEGQEGVLWIANVLQPGFNEQGKLAIINADKYAVYADDPDRPEGYEPDGGYTPPPGFEGYPDY